MRFSNGPGPAGLILTAALLLLAPPAGAQSSPAQDYPSRPVTLVVPYPAGGGLDVFARQLAQNLADRLGKPVVVENRTGAGTVIGAASVAKAAPDGYTIMLGTSTPFAINVNAEQEPALRSGQGFRADRAHLQRAVPAAGASRAAGPLGRRSGSRSLKSQPGQLSYGSAGPGSPQHLSLELLKTMTGINIVHVPYRGDAPALNDLVAGHIPTHVRRADPGPAAAQGRQGPRARRVVRVAPADRA